jgi:serine/threonine-protein kinase RsbW
MGWVEVGTLKEIKAPATLESLKQFMQFVSEFAGAQQFPQERIREIELATEEALLNILNHAYPGDCKGEIEVQCERLDDSGLTIRVVDTGIPFNPLSFSDPDLTTPVTERNPGGLGVFLIRKMMDEIRYHRSGDRNVLTFIARKRDPRPPLA